MNKKFLISVVERRFRSSDLGNTRNNFRKEKNPDKKSNALDNINECEVIGSMKKILDIKEYDEQTVKITDEHITEIKEYLRALDLIIDCPLKSDFTEIPAEYVLFTQPGMRYCQAQALVNSVIKDEKFKNLDSSEIKLVITRILDDVKGRMMEDIVLLECIKRAGRKYEVFKLQFDYGEFDMVIYDSEKNLCAVYEIKHTDKPYENQYRHLTDMVLCGKTEKRFGKIIRKTVLYRGEKFIAEKEGNKIIYENVSDFLKNLPKSMEIVC